MYMEYVYANFYFFYKRSTGYRLSYTLLTVPRKSATEKCVTDNYAQKSAHVFFWIDNSKNSKEQLYIKYSLIEHLFTKYDQVKQN